MQPSARRLAAAVLGATLLPTQALAWDYSESQDPMDDVNQAGIGQVAEGSTADSSVFLGFKCWQGQPDSTTIIVGATPDVGTTSGGKDDEGVRIRIDKNTPVELLLHASPGGGVQTFMVSAGDDPQVNAIIDQVAAARQKVIIQLGTMIYTFRVRGAEKAVKKFRERCTPTTITP